jgi:hypothetical protein
VGVGKGRALLRQTVLEVLNGEARSLNTPPVSDRMLEDWISENLLPAPVSKSLGRHGSEWMYSPASLKAALEVVGLKASGPKRRNTVLRIRLWLRGFDVPIGRIADDLKSEFRRALHRHFFRNPFRYDASTGADLSEREKENERRRAGQLDPTFVDAELELPQDDILRLSWEATSDRVRSSDYLSTLDHVVSPFLSERGRGALDVFLKSIEPYIDTSGLLGNPDEIERSGWRPLLLSVKTILQKAVSSTNSRCRWPIVPSAARNSFRHIFCSN